MTATTLCPNANASRREFRHPDKYIIMENTCLASRAERSQGACFPPASDLVEPDIASSRSLSHCERFAFTGGCPKAEAGGDGDPRQVVTGASI